MSQEKAMEISGLLQQHLLPISNPIREELTEKYSQISKLNVNTRVAENVDPETDEITVTGTITITMRPAS